MAKRKQPAAERRPLKPRSGDLVMVRWCDIAGGEGGQEDAHCPVFETPGFYLGIRTKNGERILVTERSSGELGWLMGWDSYPMSIVKDVEVVRRKGGK